MNEKAGWKEVRRKCQERLSRDITILVEFLSRFQPKTIVLVGGYGRDEGSWILENGTVIPYNDYDVTLIVDELIPIEQLAKLRCTLAKEIGIRWVDVDQHSRSSLMHLRPTIKSYDLKYAGKVIYGNENILAEIREIKNEELPLREAEVLFFTRLWTFLGSLEVDGFHRTIEGEESRFFRNQMAKALLAVADTLLLQNGAYHPSYVERNRRLMQLCGDKTQLTEMCSWALQEKLFPEAQLMRPEEVIQLYSTSLALYFETMMEALRHLYGKPLSTIVGLERAYRWSVLNGARVLKNVVLNGSSAVYNHLKMDMAQAYIAGSKLWRGEEKAYLERGVALMREVSPSMRSDLTWDEARILAAKLRMVI